LLKQFTKSVLETSLIEEMAEHLGLVARMVVDAVDPTMLFDSLTLKCPSAYLVALRPSGPVRGM